MSQEVFSDIVGHEGAKRILTSALTRPHHAYLLIGGGGLGARTLAERFTRALLSMNATQSLAAHPDCAVLTGAEGKKTIAVEQVREVCARMARKPVAGKHVVVFVPAADRLNEAGANALLKCLEEPPSYGVFVMAASSLHGLPATVQSRSLTLQLAPVPARQIDAWLAARGVQAGECNMAVQFAAGKPGRALKYLEQADERVRAAEHARMVDALLVAPTPGHAIAVLDAPARAAEAADDPRDAWEHLLDGLMHALSSDRMAEHVPAALPVGRALVAARRNVSGPVSPRVWLEMGLVGDAAPVH
jgi:replication-associated recombination protein RarA